jgi:integrase
LLLEIEHTDKGSIMASITKLGRGKQPPRAIEFVDRKDGNKRKRIRLGVVPLEAAVEAKFRIERLYAAKALNQPPDASTLDWLQGLNDDIYVRIARAGLCDAREPEPSSPTLREYLTKYIEQRSPELQPSSVQRLKDTRIELERFFGEHASLAEITPDRAHDWRAELRGRLSEATTRLHCRNAKTAFNSAVERELIERNPFKKLKSSAVAATRDRYVSLDEAEKILEQCPDHRWRVLFALCRFGGLRCPSETHAVTREDVDWELGRLTVRDKKRKRVRVIPIFPRLRPFLEQLFDQAGEGAKRIVELSRNNLHRGFKAILRRAGLEPWEDLFQTLRRSAETDLAKENPQHAVSAWIGHSMEVSARHYLQIPDDLFDRASGKSISSDTPNAAVRSPRTHEDKSLAPESSAAESAAAGPRTALQATAREKSTGTESGDCAKSNPRNRNDLRSNAGECSAVHEVRLSGLEPETYGLKVRCSTD